MKRILILIGLITIIAVQCADAFILSSMLGKSKQVNSISLTDPSDMTVGDPDQTIICSATSGNECVLSTNNSSYCTIVSGKLHAVGASGTNGCIVYANDNGGMDYMPAVQVSQSVTISAAASACTQRFSDDFNRSNNSTVGNGWSEYDSTWSISSNTVTYGSSDTGFLVNGTALSGTTQYARLKLSTMVSGKNQGIFLRGTESGDYFYIIWADRTYTMWGDASGNVQINNGGISWSSGDVIGVIVKGSGNDTVVSLWKNPTNTVPYSGGGACTDTAKPCWDNAGDTPDLQLTNNPTSPANTGTYNGIVHYGTGLYSDDFYVGDCSD